MTRTEKKKLKLEIQIIHQMGICHELRGGFSAWSRPIAKLNALRHTYEVLYGELPERCQGDNRA